MKLLIADDEDYTREGLIESIPWQEYGIDEIMQAVNGTEALKIAGWFRPDIVLTDIRMPQMDGIEFATRLAQENPDSRIIFMSGYMEIEYLKSAIRLAAVDYIEKPIDLDVVQKAIRKAVEDISSRKRSREAVQSGRQLQRQKLFRLLVSKDPDRMTVEKLAAETGFPLHAYYVCLILLPEKESAAAACASEPEKIPGLSDGTFCGMLAFQSEKDRLELLIAFTEKEQYRLSSVYRKILDAFPDSRLGAGMEVRDYKAIYNSYRTASAAINCAFYQDEKRFFQIDEGILQHSVIDPGIYGEFLHVLSERPEELSGWFDDLFTLLRDKKYYKKEQVYSLMTSLITAIYRRFPELYSVGPGGPGSDGCGAGILKEEQIQPYLSGLKNLTAVQGFIRPLLTVLESRRKEQSGYNRVIRGVQDYIAHHYGDAALSVSSIAEQFHLSSAYLNVLFKQELKITLKQYLSAYRLEMAKKLLDQGYDRVAEIAEQCGYASANYFAKVFRDATGMSPLEYRKEREKRQ